MTGDRCGTHLPESVRELSQQGEGRRTGTLLKSNVPRCVPGLASCCRQHPRRERDVRDRQPVARLRAATVTHGEDEVVEVRCQRRCRVRDRYRRETWWVNHAGGLYVGKRSARQGGTSQNGRIKSGRVKNCIRQIGVGEIGSRQIGGRKIRAGEIGARKIRARQVLIGHRDTLEITTRKINTRTGIRRTLGYAASSCIALDTRNTLVTLDALRARVTFHSRNALIALLTVGARVALDALDTL